MNEWLHKFILCPTCLSENEPYIPKFVFLEVVGSATSYLFSYKK